MNYYTWCFAVPVPKDQPIDMPKQFEMVTMFRSLSMKDKQRFLTWIDECVDRDIVMAETKLPIEKLGNRPLGNEKQMANAIIIS